MAIYLVLGFAGFLLVFWVATRLSLPAWGLLALIAVLAGLANGLLSSHPLIAAGCAGAAALAWLVNEIWYRAYYAEEPEQHRNSRLHAKMDVDRWRAKVRRRPPVR